jgi:hypothetical protein
MSGPVRQATALPGTLDGAWMAPALVASKILESGGAPSAAGSPRGSTIQEGA